MNYSTQESVVDKWIDGKDVYQITFQDPSFPIDISSLNIDILIHCEATLNNGGQYLIPGAMRGVYIDSGKRIQTFGSGTTKSLTIQYTKTS